MDPVELLKKKLEETTEQQLNDTIAKGVLKLSDEQIATVSFAFWFVYLAETDLNDSLVQAWEISRASYTADVEAMAKEKIHELVDSSACSSCGTPGKGRRINVQQPEYFADKIKLHQALTGKTDRVNLLWQLNKIRNDISHNRIDALEYNGRSLTLRKTKEELLSDYMNSMFEGDLSKAELWNALPLGQQRELREIFEKEMGSPFDDF